MNKSEAKATAEIVASGLCEVAIVGNSKGTVYVYAEGMCVAVLDVPGAGVRGAASETLARGMLRAERRRIATDGHGWSADVATRELDYSVSPGVAKHAFREIVGALRRWERQNPTAARVRSEQNGAARAALNAWVKAH